MASMEETFSDYLKHTQSRERRLASIEESLLTSNKELNSIRVSIEERIKLLEQKEKELHNFHKEVMNNFSSKEKKLASVKENLRECMKEVELKEEIFVNSLNSETEVNCSDGNIRCVVTMDANYLMKFLNERAKEQDHESMSEEVTRLLRLSPDPAKLVLDVVQGFHPGKGDLEFESDVGRICVLLLEKLIGLKPVIRSHVKEAASKVACEWKPEVGDNSCEVLGFLCFLAAYDLGSTFASREVLSLLETVAHHKDTPKLFKQLGFTHKVPGLITRLIEKKQMLQAMRYVYVFELVDSFPPLPLLESHLVYLEALGKELCDGGYNSSKMKKWLRSEIENSLRDIVGCIADHSLGLACLPTKLIAKVQELKSHKKPVMYDTPPDEDTSDYRHKRSKRSQTSGSRQI